MKWSYSGNNRPQVWGDLHSDYVLCSTGHFQSPIDISKYVAASDMPSLGFEYRPGLLEIQYDGRMLVAKPQAGSYLKYGKSRYDLIEIVFHAPSEHYVDSLAADVEIQLRHVNKAGREVYVALLGVEGRKHQKSRTLWDKLPSYSGQTTRVIGFNPIHLLPGGRSYFRYDGSQTHPPCKQGISWVVLTKYVSFSHNQINKLESLLGNNVRPLQPIFSRVPLRSR